MAKQNEQFENEKSNLSYTERIKLLSNEFLTDLNENPKYKQFFEKYNTSSIENFKKFYAEDKASIVVNSKYYIESDENYINVFSGFAWNKLWEIQQRKLFDMQCLWRAEKIKINDINVTYDFDYWSKRIEDCNFLPPIKEEELDRYIQYLEETSYDDIFFYNDYLFSWQDYEDFKKLYINDKDEYADELPPWYIYYEAATGLSSLYMLPDLKGEKEKRYIKIAADKHNEEEKENKKNTPQPLCDERPSFEYYDKEELEKFIRTFEQYKILYAYQCRDKWNDVHDDKELKDAIETLKTADRPVYLDGNTEWRESIINASNNYIKRRIIEELPNVYKNYLFRIKNGLAFEKKNRWKERIDHVGNYYKEKILEGRSILGEPRNFDY